TMLYLLRLKDDYLSDGHVITQALASVPRALAATADLAKAYDQLNSSVGQFATDTLIADSRALASGSTSDDSLYQGEAAAAIKLTLSEAAGGIRTPTQGQIQGGVSQVESLLNRARSLAAS